MEVMQFHCFNTFIFGGYAILFYGLFFGNCLQDVRCIFCEKIELSLTIRRDSFHSVIFCVHAVGIKEWNSSSVHLL